MTWAAEICRIARCHGASQRKALNGNFIIFKSFSVLGAVRAERAAFAVDLVTLATYRSHHRKRGHSEIASQQEQFPLDAIGLPAGEGPQAFR